MAHVHSRRDPAVAHRVGINGTSSRVHRLRYGPLQKQREKKIKEAPSSQKGTKLVSSTVGHGSLRRLLEGGSKGRSELAFRPTGCRCRVCVRERHSSLDFSMRHFRSRGARDRTGAGTARKKDCRSSVDTTSASPGARKMALGNRKTARGRFRTAERRVRARRCSEL